VPKSKVSNRWYLEQLNTFPVSGKKCSRTSQADQCVWKDFTTNTSADAANASV